METIQVGDYLLTFDSMYASQDPQEIRDGDYAYEVALSKRARDRELKELIKLANTYPKSPRFKNYVLNLAKRLNRPDLAREYSQLIELEHPDYLMGWIEQAEEALNAGQVEKVPRLLGKNLELNETRNAPRVFHFSEFLAYQAICVRYFTETGDIQKAESRLALMESADPDSPITQSTVAYLQIARLKNLTEKLAVFQSRSHANEGGVPLPPQKTAPPVLTHPELLHLYEPRGKVHSTSLAPLLQLPQPSLVADLALVLKDCVYRFEYFKERDVQEGAHFDVSYAALTLLCEADAGKTGLEALLYLLSQNSSCLDYWFGDGLSEDLWMYVYELGKHELPRLFAFLREPGYYDFAYMPVTRAIEHIARNEPERKPEIAALIRETLDQYVVQAQTSAETISGAITALANMILDLRWAEFDEQIKALYDAKCVDEWVIGTWDDWQDHFLNPKYPDRRAKFIKPTLERLDELRQIWTPRSQGGTEEEEWEEPPFLLDENRKAPAPFTRSSVVPHRRETPKVGRNDLCPCGSGKKYKKCCGK